jgi:hypothetical protein
VQTNPLPAQAHEKPRSAAFKLRVASAALPLPEVFAHTLSTLRAQAAEFSCYQITGLIAAEFL